MSGHSKWATIKRAKSVTDAKKGAVFTKLSKNISLAAKQGKDPEFNPALRTAIDAAKEANMPKDNIERAILRGAGELPGQQIEEITYEGYGPYGIAIMIHCATDNLNRTAAFIKQILSKYNGKLGGPGSVNYLFKPMGIIRCEQSSDELQLQIMDAGAEEIIEEDNGLTIRVKPEQFNTLKETLQTTASFSELTQLPDIMISLDSSQISTIQALLDSLEENDDVIEVYHNAKF